MNNYTDLLKICLTDLHRIGQTEYKPLRPTTWKLKVLLALDKFLRKYDIAITKVCNATYEDRLYGLDHPAYADTMIGIKRLDNIQYCVERIVEENVPGDLIECGVWRGGACIFMRALLNEYDKQWPHLHYRNVWAADSFEGLPRPTHLKDKGDRHWTRKELAISKQQVRDNFTKYGLIEGFVMLKGFFDKTLPTIADDQKFAMIRLDGDMYESTWTALTNLYPKLSVGGYCIIDDFNLKGAREAVMDYREQEGISEDMVVIDQCSVFWKKIK